MKYILTFLLLITLAACPTPNGMPGTDKKYYDPTPPADGQYLFRIVEGETDEPGAPCGYANTRGDTIIPIGKYDLCWTDTIRTFGIVWDEELTGSEFIAIDQEGRLLYEVYFFDNGPDWPEEGLFRIIRNGKIGYADQDGFIRIEPRFECASQFSGGRAKVALECDLIPDGEYTRMESDEWFFIDKEGRMLEE